ncbi:hypothetical protein NA57DRAFT_56123 [Rhizodiscina lignyota]|uniref:Zn(2)-C6 fungal-type domain-containing protein n=1 Tax=Rhizodiscina lignyota TaxID=1504668 RepID=A0A9P4MA59_9PEZI|nr:hypothetical protein NA57DRAFT_56123 [Rhizodiscina lignyota]
MAQLRQPDTPPGTAQILSDGIPQLPERRLQHRRAAKACAACRSRKVRCDVLLRYPRLCTNCEFDSVQCIVPTNHRQRRSKAASHISSTKAHPNGQTTVQSVQPHSKNTSGVGPQEGLPTSDPTAVFDNAEMFFGLNLDSSEGIEQRELQSARLAGGNVRQDRVAGLEGRYPDLFEHIDISLRGIHYSPTPGDGDWLTNYIQFNGDQSQQAELQDTASTGQWSPCSSASFRTESNSSIAGSQAFSSLYPWIKAWSPQDLTSEQRTKIASSRATSIPRLQIVNKLVRLYFIYFHPSWPILTERDFRSILHADGLSNEQGNIKPISLALLNAVLFIASTYITQEDAQAEGFKSIRKMRDAFFTRAKILYESDCETDDFSRLQICVLLSFQRSYLNSFYDNERWILEGFRRFKAANGMLKVKASDPSVPDSTHWKRVYSCWLMRAIGMVLGLKATSEPEIISVPIDSITLPELESDLSFSWFLEADTKRDLAQYFIARVELTRHMVSICRLLLERGNPSSTVPEYASGGLANHYTVICFTRRSNALRRFTISTLHQTSLSLNSERAVLSPWAAMMREPSRSALWDSVCSTMDIFRSLEANKLVGFLPVTAIIFLLVPFTLHHLFVKNSMTCNPQSLSDLLLCAKSFQILTERYEVGDFVMDLIDASLSVAHKRMASEGPLEEYQPVSRTFESRFEQKTEMLLPPVNIHSIVIRFQEVSLAQGIIKV